MNLVGGKKYLKDIFPLVELLLHTCDPVVRKDTITSFRHFIDKQDEFSDIEKELFEVIINLQILMSHHMKQVLLLLVQNFLKISKKNIVIIY